MMYYDVSGRLITGEQQPVYPVSEPAKEVTAEGETGITTGETPPANSGSKQTTGKP